VRIDLGDLAFEYALRPVASGALHLNARDGVVYGERTTVIDNPTFDYYALGGGV
jgi:hypothetical protein